MKIKNLLQISPVVLAMACAFPSFAEDAPAAPKPGREAKGDKPGDKGGPGDISQEDREKLKAAHQKAMEDPKVKEAQKAFQDALKAAMLAADPTIGPLLEKMPMGRGEGGPGGKRGPGGPGGEGRHHPDGDKKGPHAEASESPAAK